MIKKDNNPHLSEERKQSSADICNRVAIVEILLIRLTISRLDANICNQAIIENYCPAALLS